MKKAIVISHERSGTHLLIDTIARNFLEFRDGAANRVDLDYRDHKLDRKWNGMYCDPQQMQYCLSHDLVGDSIHGKFTPGIFKSHHPYEFFEPIYDYLVNNFAVFYIARDGRDVMTSFWRHAWTMGPGFVPRAFSVGQFMRLQPYGIIDRYHGRFTPKTMLERWMLHVESWMAPRPSGVCYLTFEQLKNDFDAAIEKIALHLGLDIPDKASTPPLGGVTPWRGDMGSWKLYFNDVDVDNFWHYAMNTMELLERYHAGYYTREALSGAGGLQPGRA